MKYCSKNTLRITSGFLRNRKIEYLSSTELRASSEKIRQSVFNSLGNNLNSLSFLDLCSGSGINGFEALSRGANPICLVDINRNLKRDYLKNIKNLSVTDRDIKIMNQDLIRYLSATDDLFDIIYLDPPFQKNTDEANKTSIYYDAISIIYQRAILKNDGYLIVEYYKKFPLDKQKIGFKCTKSKLYGKIGINFFQN